MTVSKIGQSSAYRPTLIGSRHVWLHSHSPSYPSAFLTSLLVVLLCVEQVMYSLPMQGGGRGRRGGPKYDGTNTIFYLRLNVYYTHLPKVQVILQEHFLQYTIIHFYIFYMYTCLYELNRAFIASQSQNFLHTYSIRIILW